MRKDIEFKAEDGTILRGWHFVPGAEQRRTPPLSWPMATPQ